MTDYQQAISDICAKNIALKTQLESATGVIQFGTTTIDSTLREVCLRWLKENTPPK